MKTSFIMYTEYKEQIDMLTYEQKGILLEALMLYQLEEDLPEMDGITAMCFSFIKTRVDRDNKAYEEKCRKNSENGSKGGRPKKGQPPVEDEKSERFSKKPNGFSEKRTIPKKADTDIDTDTDTDIKEKGFSKENPKKKEHAEKLVAAYHDICHSLPKVKRLTDDRIETCNLRLQDHGLDTMLSCFKRAQASDYLTGKNTTGFRAAFDWLLKPENIIKVLEGNYDNRDSTKSFANFRQRGGDYNEIQKQLILRSVGTG